MICNWLGLPAAGQILMEVGGWSFATFGVGYLTPVALATHQIVLNYASMTYMVPLGIASAAAVSVGHALGAGDPGRVSAAVRGSVAYGRYVDQGPGRGHPGGARFG